MSYWSHHPELYDQIIFDRLVAEGKANEDDDPFETVQEFVKQPDSWKLAVEAERDYWESMADAAEAQRDRLEDR